MSFQISPDVDGNKVFLVRSSEIEGRLDPYFYCPEFIAIIKKLKDKKARSLKSIRVDIRKGVFDLSPQNYCKAGVPFLRVSDIKDGTISFANTVFITNEKHQEEKKTEYQSGDLVISKVGTIGEVATLPNEYKKYNISQNVVGLKIDQNIRKLIKPEFLRIFLQLQFGIKQFFRQTTTGVQPKITLEAIRNILIPIPSRKVQSAIVAKMDAAYAAKKEKEAEAERLLNSIDDYLLQELGIELPEQEENTVQSRIFTRRFSEISGGRFDPDFHKPYFYNILTNIKETGCKLTCLGKISKNIINGYDCREYTDKGLLYLRVANVKKNEFDLRTAKYIPTTDIVKDINLQTGDLLITRKGSFGIAAIVDKSVKNAVISSEIFKISLSESNKIEPVYLSFWLNSKICQIFFSKIKTGAIMGHLSRDALITVPIILPDITRQQEIADHITRIRNKAKQLQQEAKQGLEQAKQEVEAMILGEDSSTA
ncbi:MAG: hypothetical protein D3922_05945 [Candidatus Electrothrix sp. AR1]|nr:hypothetical protein [Candidatus Electrothrix sp. AR1]